MLAVSAPSAQQSLVEEAFPESAPHARSFADEKRALVDVLRNLFGYSEVGVVHESDEYGTASMLRFTALAAEVEKFSDGDVCAAVRTRFCQEVSVQDALLTMRLRIFQNQILQQ